MGTGKDFSQAATTWDEKPQRIDLAAAVSVAIKQHIPLTAGMDALEFGCGTGLVTFHLLDRLRQVTAMDSATGMLDVLRQKADTLGARNVETCHNATSIPQLAERRYDLIYSSMVFHHVPQIEPVLHALIRALRPGGYLAIADLDAEDGTFHDQAQGVEHHGIDRSWLGEQLQQAGLCEVQHCTAHTIIKKRPVGDRHYPVFLVWGRKGGL